MMCISLILNIRSSLFHIHDFYAYVAAIAPRNHFFHLYQQSNSTVFKAKFREARHCCKIIFEAVKLSLSHKKENGLQKVRRLQNNITCFFISNTFIYTNRLKFDLK